jgi:hypothetical protein
MAKRLFQGLVLFFALYAFVFLPLGKKTALEHIQAIVGTPAAQNAAEELEGGVRRLVKRLREQAPEPIDDADPWSEEGDGREAVGDVGSRARPGAPARTEPGDDGNVARPSTPRARARALSVEAPK